MLMRFFPQPPKPSYEYVGDVTGSRYSIRIKDGNEWHRCARQPQFFEAFFAETQSRSRIACLMIKPCRNPKFTIFYCHGGTVDIGKVCNSYLTLGERLNCNVFTYDYSGFGASTGEFTEQNLYSDAKTAFRILLEKYELRPENVILYGQSLGGAFAIDLATKHDVAGVVIHSVFMSVLRMAFPNTPITPFFDSFPNIDRIGKVDSPVLIIHGTNDYVVPIKHGKELHKRCKRAVPPLWVVGAGHDDIYTRSEYMERLKKFVDHDLHPPNQ